jgi:TetR/AcrR family transcriptional repressor of lmrAB and yxaGH operons
VPRPDQSRDRLVTAAAVLLRQRGYAATSTTDVLRLGGVTTGSLYHHFPGGKEDLAVAALAYSADLVYADLEAALTKAANTAQALSEWLGRLASALDNDPRDGCPIAPTALESAYASDRLREAAAAAFERWTIGITRSLVREGRPEAEARSLAIAVLALVEGALLFSRTAGNGEALTAVGGQIERLTAPVSG